MPGDGTALITIIGTLIEEKRLVITYGSLVAGVAIINKNDYRK